VFLQFGVGWTFANPTGGNLSTPTGPQFLGSVADIGLDISQKLVKLMGQSKGPDDVAPSDMEIKGKAAFGQIDPATFNALMFGDTATPAETTAPTISAREQHSVPATSTYIITVTSSATYLEDLSVYYGNNPSAVGQPFQQVASGPTIGQYSVVQSGVGKGVYTFAAADASAAVLISYKYTSTQGSDLLVTNHLQGYGPYFEMYLTMPFQNAGNMIWLRKCRMSKTSFPQKRDNYTIPDFEFESYPDSNGNWFNLVSNLP
jgi:hypothetical protein